MRAAMLEKFPRAEKNKGLTRISFPMEHKYNGKCQNGFANKIDYPPEMD
jgi:hypothetical protein